MVVLDLQSRNSAEFDRGGVDVLAWFGASFYFISLRCTLGTQLIGRKPAITLNAGDVKKIIKFYRGSNIGLSWMQIGRDYAVLIAPGCLFEIAKQLNGRIESSKKYGHVRCCGLEFSYEIRTQKNTDKHFAYIELPGMRADHCWIAKQQGDTTGCCSVFELAGNEVAGNEERLKVPRLSWKGAKLLRELLVKFELAKTPFAFKEPELLAELEPLRLLWV